MYPLDQVFMALVGLLDLGASTFGEFDTVRTGPVQSGLPHSIDISRNFIRFQLNNLRPIQHPQELSLDSCGQSPHLPAPAKAARSRYSYLYTPYVPLMA